ncbi:hypothetical protein OPV22_020239 [Ensete ventricosum]|uniref:XS domain-containing protein n=1 Tax=Ensete ventricosum TaxID=4639 RepID=A0AAV8QMU2_ENSVE|nr:hypothetical protein OPV22_020239 [Ensete ventricosum]
MRGRAHATGGRGGRGDRGLSPPAAAAAAHTKDNRSDWHRNRFLHRSRRNSLSPPNRDRRSPDRRSSTVERRDYAPWHSDYARQLHYEPSQPPQLHGRPSPFGCNSYEIPHRFMLPGDPRNLDSEVNPGLRLSHLIKDKDILQSGNGALGMSSLGLETQNSHYRRSLFLDDGSPQNFHSLHADANYSLDASVLKLDNMGRSKDSLNVAHHDYHDQLRNPYDERLGGKAYFKDTPFATTDPPFPRLYGGASSSSFPKDDMLGLYDNHLRRPLDGSIRDAPSKFMDDTVESIGYSQKQFSEPVRWGPLSPARTEPRYRGYDEINRRELSDREFLVLDDMHEKVPWGSRTDHREKIGSSLRDLVGVRVGELDTSRNVTSEHSLWDKQRSLHGDADLDYREGKGIIVDYVDSSANGHLGYRVKPSRFHQLTSLQETYALGIDAAPTSYKERPKSPMYSGHRMDIYGQVVSSPRRESEMEGLYHLSSERMTRRKYVTHSYINEFDPRSVASNDRTAFRRISSPGVADDIWPEEERQGDINSKELDFGHTNYMSLSHRMSRSDARLPSGGTYKHAERGHGMSLKRRLRPGPSESRGPYTSERRKEFRPNKFWKKDIVDRHDDLNHDGNVPRDDNVLVKRDPAEGSVEFKQQVHKAFLRFFKSLNENPQQLKRYQEQGQGSPLLCCVCGSMSKEFVDTHSLVSHLYHSGKVGLKTEHLGLHKALCLLVEWNWLVAPDNSRVYQTGATAEAKAMKEDLILWPPVVIVHNSSAEKKVSSSQQKVLSTEGIQEILREMGFEAGKTTICHGKPANQSVFLIKFFPTFSGLQEAEKLHNCFVGCNRGRQEFYSRTPNKSKANSEHEACFKNFPCLYGYMAVAEDLPRLDSETMKRCLVKSKKDIEAIADAPLNID